MRCNTIVGWDAADAFMHSAPFRRGSTHVERWESISGETVIDLLLHGHCIARRLPHQDGWRYVRITMCGYPTRTTRDRLSALPGIDMSQQGWQQHVNGTPIDPVHYYLVDLTDGRVVKKLNTMNEALELETS